jgi:transcriptional regulator with XRE-family HTH domain
VAKRKVPKVASDQQEVERVLQLLKGVLRMLGITSREVERRLGVAPSYLSRVFTGAVEFKLEHIIAVCRVIGLHPAEFFNLAFAELPQPPSAAARELWGTLKEFKLPERVTGAAPAAPAPQQQQISVEELDERIQIALQRFFASLGRAQGS